MSQVSRLVIIPSGRYCLAFHHSCVNSLILPALSMSPASFIDKRTFFALLGVNKSITSFEAFCPASSLSKHITMLSNVSIHSRFSLMSLTALDAPFLILTTGNLQSNISATARASHSPSVIVRYLPPLDHAC